MSERSNNGPPDINIGTSLVALEWSLSGIAAVILGLRLFAAGAILRRFRAPDWLMIAAFVCAVIQGALLTKSYEWGLGRHLFYLDDEQESQALKYVTINQAWGIASAMFGRISFCVFMETFVPSHNYMWLSLRFFVCTQAIVNLVLIVIIYAQCGIHVEALWDKDVQAQCWLPVVQTHFSYFQCVWNSLTDLYLTVLPALLLKGLCIERPKKFALIFLFSLSIFALIASVIKIYEIKELDERGDLTWSLARLHFCAVPENYIIIIVASVPLLNVFMKHGRHSAHSRRYHDMNMSRWGSVPPSSQGQIWRAPNNWRSPDKSHPAGQDCESAPGTSGSHGSADGGRSQEIAVSRHNLD